MSRGMSKLQKEDAKKSPESPDDHQPSAAVQLSVAIMLLALALPKVQSWKWEADTPRSAPTTEWMYLGVCVCAMYTAARAILFPLVLRPLARTLGAPDETKTLKVAQQAINLFHHLTCTVLAIKLLGGEDFFYWNEPLGMWKGWAEGAHLHTAEVHALYMLQLGYHSYCLAFHFTDPKRDDFMQMLVHHAVTAYLIYQSYLSNFVHVGLLVLFAHDASDVVGCSIKLTNYINYKYTTVAIFPVLLFAWGYTRLWLFPSNCIVASWRYSEGFHRSSGYCACFLLMFVILGLNAYWYCLFLNMAVNLLRSSLKNPCTTDLSEEKNEE